MKRIAYKIIALALSVALVLSGVFVTTLLAATEAQNKDSLGLLERTLREDFDHQAKTQVENAISMLAAIYRQSQAGAFDLEEAKRRGAGLLRELRYGEEGYFWADTVEGVNVVLLGRPDEGKSRIDAVDVNGFHLIREILKMGMQPGGGYTDYWFPKKDSTVASPKRGYSLLFEPFGWVVGTGNYIDDIDLVVEATRSELEKSALGLRTTIIVLTLVLFFLTGILALLMGRRISRPIQAASEAMENVATGEGDLSHRITVRSRDETARLAAHFNDFIGKLAAIIHTIRTSTTDLQETGHDLSVNLSETASALNQITANVESMNQRILTQSSSVSETQATVGLIGKTIGDLNNLIQEQAAGVTESSAAIEQMIANIGTVSGNVEQIGRVFQDLLAASDGGKQKLSLVTDLVQRIQGESEALLETNEVIKSIASQTNLLAMNAAIEAAHAGDTGRGFAVVSDEIRKLAENAAEQSNVVAKNIDTIIQGVRAVANSTQEAESAFDQTLRLIHEVDNREQEVKQSLIEQTLGSRQILEALAKINEVTATITQSSVEMAGGSRQILEEITQLAALTGEIRSGMNEISAGTRQINTSVNGISDLGIRNKQSIDQVNSEISRFTVREA